MWLRVGTGAGCCECGNESLSSIRCRGIFRLAEELFFSGRTLLHAVMESPFPRLRGEAEKKYIYLLGLKRTRASRAQ